jgi:hypothetical protein
MPLKSPNLDDRDFDQLVEEARRQIIQSCPEWTDLSPGDPGIMLLELFAHLTEVMIYRLNRLPEKAYIKFLNLLGVNLAPPASATVALRFSVSRELNTPLDIPRGTRVTIARAASGTEPPQFVTARSATIKPGDNTVDVIAHHCDLVEAEVAGKGSGLPGLSLSVRRPPIVSPTGDELDLLVAVEAAADELGERVPAIQYNGKAYRIWREVENFTNLGSDRFVYVVDRITGTITFAPAIKMMKAEGQMDRTPQALAEVVKEGREILLSYRTGGGPSGNVAANSLTILKDQIPGVQVTNPKPATGGRAAEALENALIRGPQEIHSLQRAVTASDFELVALRNSGAVIRAKAFTKAAIWTYAMPGTVEVLLVPHVPEEMQSGGRVTIEKLIEQETEEASLRIQKILNERRPLGTVCLVSWVKYKTVQVKARVVVHTGEDPAAVKERVLERLYQTINPLITLIHPNGWPFGMPLRTSNIYDIILSEPGVSYADQVRLLVDNVPEEKVRSLIADSFQPNTWYAATDHELFRSLNDGEGWERVADFPDEELTIVEAHSAKAGALAVTTLLPGDKKESRLHISHDCGETWHVAAQTGFIIRDMAWTLRAGISVLLLATDAGLYELAMQPTATPVQILVDQDNQDLGFYAVVASTDIQGMAYVAVAAQKRRGVFLSSQGGQQKTYSNIGQQDEDIRILAIQKDGPRNFLWTGLAVPGNEEGKGCFRRELLGSSTPPEGWLQFSNNWTGGSCRSLAFQGPRVIAATHHAGVLWLDSTKSDAAWVKPDLGCGLPIRDVKHLLQPVDAVSVDPEARLILASGPKGVYRSDDGSKYETISKKEFTDKVTLPRTWLFCSGEHDIEVIGQDETN